MCTSCAHPIVKTISSNWIPLIGHQRDHTPIMWQIGVQRANQDVDAIIIVIIIVPFFRAQIHYLTAQAKLKLEIRKPELTYTN